VKEVCRLDPPVTSATNVFKTETPIEFTPKDKIIFGDGTLHAVHTSLHAV